METPTNFDPAFIEQMAMMIAKTQQEQQQKDAIEWDRDSESLDNFLLRQIFPKTTDYISLAEGKEMYERTAKGYFRRVNRTLLERKVLNFLQDHMPRSAKAKPAEDAVKMLIMKAEMTGEEWTERVNPDGYLNCTNGVLRILPCGVKLLAKDDDEVADFIFLDEPRVTYDPEADRSHAEQLMFGSLVGESRVLYQRVMGSSLNVTAVRQMVDRIPALNSPNTSGANGKSANNGIIARIHGPSAVATLGLEYFLSKKGDDPARNDLYMLAGKKVNLPSESDSNFNLSNLANLKAAISGDELKSRGLFKDAFVFNPRCVFHFSLNSNTIINGTSEATTTRWRLLEWPFSFVAEPTQQHHKKGEPRLNPTGGDHAFIDEHVLPGYLNLLIDGFLGACAHGFPDVESRERLESNTAEHDHVAEFLKDMQLQPADPNGKPFITQKELHQIYLFWLKFFKLEEDDDAFDAIGYSNPGCFVQDRRMLRGDSKYDSPKATGAELGAYLKSRQTRVARPNIQRCDALGIKRDTWVWLEPKDLDNLPEAFRQAVFNLDLPILFESVGGKDRISQGATDQKSEMFDF